MQTTMKKTLFLLITILTVNCSYNKKNDKHKLETNIQNNFTHTIKHSNIDSLRKYISNPCDSFTIVFEGLYPIMDTLPSSDVDTLMADNILKELGYTVNNSGWGNWMNGPRIMSLELKKDKCTCMVNKKYYYHEKLADGAYNLRVTEVVTCNTSALSEE
jgi:hypothetical protein